MLVPVTDAQHHVNAAPSAVPSDSVRTGPSRPAGGPISRESMSVELPGECEWSGLFLEAGSSGTKDRTWGWNPARPHSYLFHKLRSKCRRWQIRPGSGTASLQQLLSRNSPSMPWPPEAARCAETDM
ncbi:hypothetical protein NQZ68_029375 [Dissostichus eleginoides]|nr:hypothetical protein NQZ68_029375 [Dissostichus eleginoides]